MSETLKKKILKALIKSKNISETDITDALAYAQERGQSLERILIERRLIQEEDLLMLLVRELNIPFINLRKYKIDPRLKEIVPERIARQYQIIPLSALDYTLTIALSDPLDVFVVDDIKNITGREVDVVMSTSSDIAAAIDTYYGSDASSRLTDVSKDIEVENFEIITEREDETIGDETLGESEKAPIVRMVNLVLKEALRQRASDIHMEPMSDCMRVRYRIDGILQDVLKIPKRNQNSIIVRIKIMARLDITMNYTPQDGRFKMRIPGKEVDFRVSLLPTTFGQKVVMRVLDKQNLAVGMSGLGIAPHALATLQQAIKKPFGMILVTGPTGSGKSTTLYTLINELNTVDRNVITVEDPVEYLIEGLTQIQAMPEIGLTFAEGLRAILRQSPDVVMVGEIRDSETADIAIKSSLTGQIVFSTLHTNDAAGALTRLVDMGVEPFLVASSLVVVTAQRLCRRICIKCKEEIPLTEKIRDQIGYDFSDMDKIYAGKGCDACHQSGYRGRMCITEILDIDDTVREMLIKGNSSDDIKAYARKHLGMKILWEDAMAKCLAGETTLEEVLRITTNE